MPSRSCSLNTRLLLLLEEDGNRYWTAEDLALRLNAARSTVHQHLRLLRACGFEIECVPHLGHRLTGKPDGVTDFELESLLRGTRFEGKVHVLDTVVSTNDIAHNLARRTDAEGAVVCAREQTGGRGRQGRRWFSPPREGLYVSVVLRPPLPPRLFHQLTLMTAAACAEHLNTVSAQPVRIKWPNDLLTGGRKCGGILTEIRTRGETLLYAVVGIGVNWSIGAEAFRHHRLDQASALELRPGAPRRVECLAGMLRRIESLYALLREGRFETVRARWLALCETPGRRVHVRRGSRSVEGAAETIDAEGALIVRLPDGSRCAVLDGDVSPPDRA